MSGPDALAWVVEGLPHAPPMRLIDAVLEVKGRRIVCAARIGEDHVLLERGVVSALAALELFAQAAAALLVYHARRSGDVAVQGYLLGARQLACSVDHFEVGDVLEVVVEESFADGALASFEGTLRRRGVTVVTGAIHVASTR